MAGSGYRQNDTRVNRLSTRRRPTRRPAPITSADHREEARSTTRPAPVAVH